MISFVGLCARTKVAVSSVQFVPFVTVVPQRFYATKAKPAPPSTTAKSTKIKGTSVGKSVVKGTAIKGAPATTKKVDPEKAREKELQAKLAKAKLKEKEKKAARKGKEKENKEKEKEAQAKKKESKAAGEKKKADGEKASLKKRREQEKKKEMKEKEQEKSKLLAQKAKQKQLAEKQKKAQQIAKARAAKKAVKDKETAKLTQERDKKRAAMAAKKAQPKRALSAYIFFSREIRPTVAKDGKSASDVLKEIATKWNALSAGEKKKYEEMSAKDRIRYQSARTEYQKAHPAPPKKPQSPYIFFVKDIYKKVKGDNPDMSASELMKPISDKWRELTAEQKKAYEKQAAASRDKYDKDFKAHQKTSAPKA